LAVACFGRRRDIKTGEILIIWRSAQTITLYNGKYRALVLPSYLFELKCLGLFVKRAKEQKRMFRGQMSSLDVWIGAFVLFLISGGT
jgi:hypothetical protein